MNTVNRSLIVQVNACGCVELGEEHFDRNGDFRCAINTDKFNAATSIDLHDQRTIDGIHGLQAAGLLTAARSAVILA